MNPDKAVMHVVDRQRRGVIIDLLGESVRQPGESPVVHPDREVLALYVGRADVLRIRSSLDYFRFAANALRRAIAFLTFRRVVSPRQRDLRK
jgi:hypothetical protein